MTRNKK
jgi:hypothetical protein